jgi:hypothetical protein
MAKLFREKIVKETAKFIADELRKVLDRHKCDSYMSQRLNDCPTYHKPHNLKNGEGMLATIRALAMVQIDMTRELASMNYGEGPEEEDYLGQAEPLARVLTDAEVVSLHPDPRQG